MKNKFIEVYDDLLPENFCNFLEDSFYTRDTRMAVPFHATETLTDKRNGSKTDYGFFHVFFADEQSCPINSHLANFLLTPLYTLAISKNIAIKGIYQGRCFLQMPDLNPRPQDPHVDIEDLPHWVCLYYVNDSDGDTIFYEDDKKTEIKRVSPKKGRIAFFDGTIWHSGSKPSFSRRGVINIIFNGEQI